ncbi:MAG: hypothetical protein J3K34DRAFT_517743 [Monoraphidium minutum]|nr:MAG: hypothetical protein J3K34DRAFT_517743 [Monoraphidium minutum]
MRHVHSLARACPGERGYALQQCLRKARAERGDAEGGDGEGGGGGGADDPQAERLRYRQYEQPGELVTLPSGIQYRELSAGAGRAAEAGGTLEIAYTVYRLSARATPVYAWSYGTGAGGRDDVGEVYRFRLGDARAVPAAVAAGLLGMREGGKRRVLVPPRLGWVDDGVGPPRPDFTAVRRLATHRNEPLLFEAELVKAVPAARDDELAAAEAAALEYLTQRPGDPYRLPRPRSPFQKNLPE